MGDVQVGDEDGAESLIAQVVDHGFEVGEARAIDGEGAVAVLVIDIEIDHVGGDVFIAEGLRDLADAGFRKIAVAGLLVAERPERRQRRSSGERGEGGEDALGFGAEEEIIVEFAAFGAEGVGVVAGLAEVERGAPGVVHEDAVGAAVAHAVEEGNGFVERVGRFLPAVLVGVPQGKGAVAEVEGGLIAESEVELVFGHLSGDAEAGAVEGGGFGVFADDVVLGIEEGDAQGVAGDAHVSGGKVEGDGVGRLR